MNKGGRPQN